METPKFTITAKTLDLATEIAEYVGKIQGAGAYSRNLHLRKVNRLRSIQSSTAIEGNTLTLEEVTDVIEGKRVLGGSREILEVKNAYAAYEHMEEYSPYKVEDFLKAHGFMAEGLVKNAGHFRNRGVGVFSGDTLIHAGANPEFVPRLIRDLFLWAEAAELNPLIKSSIVHFEIELIHPFLDGNGRMGRLWQTLILSKWNEIFAWLPIETVVYENQQGYYDTLSRSERRMDSGEFIEFMLDAVLQALTGLPTKKITDIFTDINTDILSKTEVEFLEQIVDFLDKNGEITNYRAQLLTGKSEESVKKYLARFVELGLFKAEGENKGRKYLINR